MLTLKLISEETERVIKGLEKKHFPNAREAVEKVLEYDKIRREAQQKLDTNKQQANQFAKQTSEHRSMYSYVRLSIDRCTATYV